jgi:hypothetical protein
VGQGVAAVRVFPDVPEQLSQGDRHRVCHGSELGDFTRMLVSAAAAVVAAVAALGSPAADRPMAPA